MASIEVRAKLYGTLRDRVSGGYDHEKGINVSVSEGATVQDLLIAIGLSEREAGFFVVNGTPGRLGDRLAEGDEISFFLPLGGG